MNNVDVVIARCSQRRNLFGIRFEEMSPRTWHATWAFLLRPEVADHKGYSRSRIKGSFQIAHGYPGCPAGDCSNGSFVLCGCGRLACAPVGAEHFTCPWCGDGGPVSGSITGLDGGGDG